MWRYWLQFYCCRRGIDDDDYSEAQREAWPAADDEEQFGKRLAPNNTDRELQNSPVGFASLKGADHIDMLHSPRRHRQGVASMLCDALEKLAGGRGRRA